MNGWEATEGMVRFRDLVQSSGNTSSTHLPPTWFFLSCHICCILFVTDSKVLLLKSWLWPDSVCIVRCFGFCHGSVWSWSYWKYVMYLHGVSSRQKPVLWPACIIYVTWEKLLLKLLKYWRGWILQEKYSSPSHDTLISTCHESPLLTLFSSE